LTEPLKHVLREMGPAAREFYARLERGSIETTRCTRCGDLRFPPRERCPACSGPVEWRELSGRGAVYAFTQQERGFRFTAPDTIGIAELEEGVRVFGVFEAPLEELTIGAPVLAVAKPDDEGVPLLAFRLTGE
jgi:uncharacterized OB-fold protein